MKINLERQMDTNIRRKKVLKELDNHTTKQRLELALLEELIKDQQERLRNLKENI